MKHYPFALITLLTATLIFNQSCNHNASSLPEFPSDSIDVFAELIPNEDRQSSFHTYGNDSVVGHDITYRMATDSARNYVDVRLNVLELHPRITANLLSFIHGEMLFQGFINENDTIPPFDIYSKSNEGYSQSEIVRSFLDWESGRFHKELESGEDGFYINFDVEPVFLNDKYVTYSKYVYSYTGGAHGDYSTFLQTYNRETGKTVNLTDMVEPNMMDKLRERVALHMAVNYPIYSPVNSVEEYLDSLNRWKRDTDVALKFGLKKESECERITLKNYPLNDPGIHEAGLVFTYEKYHLTPGVSGCPTVLVTFDEIRDCLKEPFRNYRTDPSKIRKIKEIDYPNYISNTQLDSIRAARGTAADGGKWPREISDWYKYRHGNIKHHYPIGSIIGKWQGYGPKRNTRNTLSIKADGSFIHEREEATNEAEKGKIRYEYAETIQGRYKYNPQWNQLTLNNWQSIELNEENLEAFVKQRNPQNKYMIIHSIVRDTMYVADEVGNLWPYIRRKE